MQYTLELGLYRHIKTGKVYLVTGTRIETTNGEMDNEVKVDYTDGELNFSRVVSEFCEKFRLILSAGDHLCEGKIHPIWIKDDDIPHHLRSRKVATGYNDSSGSILFFNDGSIYISAADEVIYCQNIEGLFHLKSRAS